MGLRILEKVESAPIKSLLEFLKYPENYPCKYSVIHLSGGVL